jgi:hypothetical protein
MPLIWKRGENPYRTSYFAILELGSSATPGQITATGKSIATKIQHGAKHIVGNREVLEPEIYEAESRLRDEGHWALEVLMVHPSSVGDSSRLQQICREVMAESAPPPRPSVLRFTNLQALAPFIPEPSADDITWPEWDEFQIPGPESPVDRADDIQFDL